MIVDTVDLEVMAGEFLGIIGPNGSGKTSLISLLAGIRPPRSGTVRLEERPLAQATRRDIAQCITLVEQQAETTERITARQAVELGRTPHLGALSPWSRRDTDIVDRALEHVGMSDFAGRMWHTLSGGERQRLHIARALAQQPQILTEDRILAVFGVAATVEHDEDGCCFVRYRRARPKLHLISDNTRRQDHAR